MLTNSYRMGEYKITESDSGELTWESHRGFGALQRGRCFRKGQILFIGPAETDAPGFLKREFLEHLKPLPVWSKTRYYCKSLDIHHCKTHKRVTKSEMRLWAFDRDRDSDHVFEMPAGTEVAYRLLGYEIIREGDGRIIWKASSGASTISKGECVIAENILFIGPKYSMETDVSRRRFISNLKNLPDWNHTSYYSIKTSLANWHALSSGKTKNTWPSAKQEMVNHFSVKHRKGFIDLRLRGSRLGALRNNGFFSSGLGKSRRYIRNGLLLTVSVALPYVIAHFRALKEKWYQKKGSLKRDAKN